MEIWKLYPGGYVDVSTHGRLRRLNNTRGPGPRMGVPHKGHRAGNKRQSRYRCVCVGGTKKYVHKMVMETFNPNPSQAVYDRIDHISAELDEDGCRSNRLTNLRWSNRRLNGTNPTNRSSCVNNNRGRWTVGIVYEKNGDPQILGRFANKEDALALAAKKQESRFAAMDAVYGILAKVL